MKNFDQHIVHFPNNQTTMPQDSSPTLEASDFDRNLMGFTFSSLFISENITGLIQE